MQLKLFILPVKSLFALIGLVLLVLQHADAAGPTVSNVRASQRAGTQLVDIYYDLADPDSPVLAVVVAVSSNGGATYDLPAISFSVTATGALPLYFQWQKDGINIPDATASSLILRNCQRIDKGTYNVIVSNSAGSTTSSGALLRVITVGGGHF